MNRLRLSICIATLNRAGFIGQTLESILPQVTDEVEVVIVDGASTDGTENVVGRFAERFPNLKYIRLAKKGGVDQDYCQAVELARGEYIWLFTDDDLLKPGAVAAVLEASRQNYSLIIVNAEVRSVDLRELLVPIRIKLEADRVYPPTAPERDQLLADIGHYASFIGAVVMKRELWNQREKAKYFGSAFVHIGVIFQSPLPGDALVTAYPWIVIRYGNCEWTPRTFEIWMIKWPALVWSFTHWADWSKSRVVSARPWGSPAQLAYLRARELYGLREYETWVATRLKSPIKRLLCRTIAVAPVGCLNLLARFCVRFILRKIPSIPWYDLQEWRKKHRLSTGP